MKKSIWRMKEGKDVDEGGKDEEEGKEKRKRGQLPVHGRQVRTLFFVRCKVPRKRKKPKESTYLQSAEYYPSLPTFT